MKPNPNPNTEQLRMDSPLGPLNLGATPQGLAWVWFERAQKHAPDASAWKQAGRHPLLLEASRQLKAYFAGKLTAFDVPLDLGSGSAFQQSVWQALLEIPRGATWSYGAMAGKLGKPSASRAVGAAVGRNPVGIIVPCHRVIGADRSLTGYAGGLDRKIALLRLEGVLF